MERRARYAALLLLCNFAACSPNPDVFPVHQSLDSSMKKNTAYIKRLRTGIQASAQSQFLQDVQTLSLHKYLSEIISACYEGLCKLKTPAEVATGVEVVSALHQRFGPSEFTGYMGWYIGRGLSTPDKSQLKTLSPEVREKEEKERLARQRVLLRVATELWLVGVLRSLDDVSRPEEAGKMKENIKLVETSKTRTATAANADAEPFPLEVLKDMLGHDREHVNLPLLVIFVKAFAWDILGSRTSSVEGRKTVNEDGSTTSDKKDDTSATEDDDADAKDPPIIGPELQQRFKNILKRYFEDVKAHLLRDQKQLVSQGRRNAEAYVKSGEVFEDRQANYEKQMKAQEKLITNAQVLADALGLDMPDLKEKDTSASTGDGLIGLVKTGEYLRGQGDGPGIWEDEDERRFYENLIDLKDRVPGILLEEPKKKKADDEQVGKKIETKAEVEEKDKAEGSADAKPAESDDQSTAIANKSVGAQVDAVLAKLPELNTKDAVDTTAIEFCFLNSKASRNRLIKAVQEIPKGRSDLLPLYSRLIATLGKYMPDVSQGLVTYLDDEFRSLQRRKSKDFLGQVRTQNVRYLAELTKFGVVPEHVIFHCLKVSLDDFSRMNIEIICNLLENCGRYLLRNPDTSPRMASFLETLQRKKSAQVLGQQERMLIENAMYYVNPPERAAIEQKDRTPIELFLRKIMYQDLTRRSMDKTVRTIRKMHWEEEEVVNILHKIFSKPGKIKYSNVHLLAIILGTIHRYHQDFTISVIDDLLESIIFGLELNDFKFNQRRIAEVKYLGEMYLYRLVDSPLIFDMLYKLLNYGWEGGYARPGLYNPLDLSDDYFRIRLVCNLLETCGMYFDKGTAKKKLDFFLSYFQYYLCMKDALPMDVEFIVQDAYNLTRPQWKLVSNLDEAARIFSDAVSQNYQSSASGKAVEPDDDEASEDEDEDGPDDEDLVVPEGDDDKSSGEDAEVCAHLTFVKFRFTNKCKESGDDEPVKHASSDEEEEQITVTRPEDERDPEAEAEFDRELAKLMSESVESRKFERKPVFDVPLPMRRARDTAAVAEDSGSEAPVQAPTLNTVKFSLLSKRGNKNQTRSIDLPSDSTFAVAMRNKQQAEREEQQRIKNLVLNYDLRDDDAEGESPFLYDPLRLDSNKTHTKTTQGLDKTHNPYAQPRLDKAGTNRSNQRSRKLQLSDVNWYAETPHVTKVSRLV